MAGIAAYALAGGLQGLGKGLQDQAEAARQAAIQRARDARQDAQLNQARDWQLQDRADGRAYDQEMKADGRAYDQRLKSEDRAYSQDKTNSLATVYERLWKSESGGDFSAENDAPGANGIRGHHGRLQFGQARLDDFATATGRTKIDPEAFKADPELQEEAEAWHFEDINSFIDNNDLGQYEGQKIKGVTITRSSMFAMAHLGGKGGMRRFLVSGGQYDPDDGSTKLSDYAKTHGGLSTDMTNVWRAIADPDTPAAIRGEMMERVKAINGTASGPKLSGEEWVSDGKGNEILHGSSGNQLLPYLDVNGQPITRAAKADNIKFSSGLDKELQDIFPDGGDGLSGVDYKSINAVKTEILRLMKQGMPEHVAKERALNAMVYKTEVIPAEDNKFWPDKPETTRQGEFTGTFNYGSEAPSIDTSSLPDRAIEALKSNPSLSVQFDEKYGQGSAAAVLGTR